MDAKFPTTLPAFLWHTVRRFPVASGFILLTAFSWAIDQVAWPYMFKLLVDGISTYHADKADLFTRLSPTLWLMFAVWCVLQAGFRVQGLLFATYFPRMDAAIHRDLFDYVERHSYRYYSDRLVGSLADKIGGQMAGSATILLQMIIIIFIPAFISVCIAIAMMGRLHAFFAIVLGGWSLICITTGLIFGKGISRRTAAQAEAQSAMQGATVDSLVNHANVRLYAMQQHESDYVERYREAWLKKQQAALYFQEKVRLFMGVLSGAAYLGLIWLAVYAWQQSFITTGDVVYVLTTAWNIISMVWGVANFHVPNFYKQVGICTQAMRTVLAAHDLTDIPDAKPLQVTKGEIVFDNVRFHYIPGRDIFRNKNIAIRAGERVGLVGFSGSGKSTFVNLILRLYDVESGRILIDGQDIAKVTQDSLHEAIAMIPQDTSLFHRSLMENIRFGNPQATDEEVIAASKKAHCHEFIERIDQGYNALVGERGVKLSGGQRQRIAIARAVLKNAPVLILDEATSSLDSITEKYIQQGLGELMKGRTAIVIAHRLSTLSHLDRLLVFREGEIIEDGTHNALLAAAGHYARLWNMQAGGFLPDAAH